MSNVTVWLTVGFLGQLVFTARFLVQWIMSEQKRDWSCLRHFGGSVYLEGPRLVLCDFPPGSRDYRGTGHGARRLYAKHRIDGLGKAARERFQEPAA